MGNVSYDFTDRVVVVTGAANGIGRATAHAFLRAGAEVVLVDIDADSGQEAAGDRGVFHRCDVTSPDEVNALYRMVEERLGRLDVLVNNAGGFPTVRSTAELSPEQWYSMIDLNLHSVFLMSSAAVPLLRRSPAGRIISIGSLAGQVASHRTNPAYAASKAAVHALGRVMASELAPEGITVNTIAPSSVLTERIEQLRDEDGHARFRSSIPLGRYQSPEEVASWVLQVASEEAGFVTGQTLSVNGGRYMAM